MLLSIILTLLMGQDTIHFTNGQEFKPLGAHSSPSTGPILLYGKFPPPFVLFHHFVKTSKPLVMKNVLNETGYEIYNTWTNEYLSEQYGEETVEIEKSKKENRDIPRSKLSFSKFLELYKTVDMYMINKTSQAMQDDVMVPHSLQCGGFHKVLHGSHIWFSSGGTRSVLHYDMMDNIHCVLDGEKTVVMLDKSHKETIEEHGFIQNGGYSLVDVDAVDFYTYPGIAKAPWTEISLLKGDCVYIPYKWYHHIRSKPGRSLALNFWFSHLLWFNKTDCDSKGPISTLKPYSEYNMASSNEQLRSEFFLPFASLRQIQKKDFIEKSLCKKEDTEKIWKLVKILDKFDYLTWEEIYSVDIDQLVLNVPECFQTIASSGSSSESQEMDTKKLDQRNTADESSNKHVVHDEF